jgi:hypothetical protein
MHIENDSYLHTSLIEKYLAYLRNPSLRRKLLCEANSKNLNMIRTIMKNAFDNKIVCLLELIGTATTGKQATLRKAASDLNVDSFLLIDCRIYNTPDLIHQKIYGSCGVDYGLEEPEELEDEIFTGEANGFQEEKSPEHAMDEQIKSRNFWTKIFRKVFDKKKVVIYFSHIDVLCKSSRQTFLYTILDNLNMSHTKVVVAFATSHLYLIDNLDRRIKSRFSAERFFFGMNVENPENAIRSILMMKDNDAGIHVNQVGQITGYLKDLKIMQRLVRIIDTEGSFDSVIKIFIAFFCQMNAYRIQQMTTNPNNGKLIFEEYIAKAMVSVSQRDFERILKSLPKCHMDLLRTIVDLASDNPKAELIAYDISAKILTNKNIKHKYSTNILLSGMNDLEKMGFVYVNKKPITGETKVIFKMYDDFVTVFQRIQQ